MRFLLSPPLVKTQVDNCPFFSGFRIQAQRHFLSVVLFPLLSISWSFPCLPFKFLLALNKSKRQLAVIAFGVWQHSLCVTFFTVPFFWGARVFETLGRTGKNK